MEMTPLALVILLAFGLLLAASLTVWTAVRAGTSPAKEREPGEGASSGSGGLRESSQQRGQRREQERERGREQQRGQQRGQVRDPGQSPVPARERPAVDEVGAREREEPSDPGHAGKSTGQGGESGSKSSRGKSGGRGRRGENDAFERFLEARPDDMDFG